jgi:hypothetical protein
MAVRFSSGEAEARLDVRSAPAAPLTNALRRRKFA